MESPGVTNIETDDQRYSQTGSECRVHNINGNAMLPDSIVHIIFTQENSIDISLHVRKNNLTFSINAPSKRTFVVAELILNLRQTVWHKKLKCGVCFHSFVIILNDNQVH